MGEAKKRGSLDQRILLAQEKEKENEEKRTIELKRKREIEIAVKRDLFMKVNIAEEWIRENFKSMEIHGSKGTHVIDDDIEINKITNVNCEIYINSHKKMVSYDVSYIEEDGEEYCKLKQRSERASAFNVPMLAAMTAGLML